MQIACCGLPKYDHATISTRYRLLKFIENTKLIWYSNVLLMKKL